MAICEICGGEMLERVGCKIGICDCNGKSYPRIRFGAEKRFEDVFGEEDSCPDCLAPFGSFHHFGCDIEECPVCGEAIYGDCKCDLVFPDLEDLVIIKRAEQDDLQKILNLQYLAYQSEAKLFNNPDIPPLKQSLTDVVNEYQKGIVLKAEDVKGNIIGSVRAYSENGTVYIGKLFVHPERQGKGIGTKLLINIENEYPGCRYELFTSTKSEKNICLYERLGYAIFKEKEITEELKFLYLEKQN